MDALVTQLIDACKHQSDDLIRSFKDKRAKEVKRLLVKNKGGIHNAVEALDPSKHSFGVALLLGFLAQDEIDDKPTFFRQALALCTNGNEVQLAHAHDEFSAIVRKFGMLAVADSPFAGIFPLQSALSILQNGSPHLLTTAHPYFVQCCVKASALDMALPIISGDLLEVDSSMSESFDPVTAKENLLYHYHAGHVFNAVKQRQRAIESFLNALTAPSDRVSAIQLAAFKEWVLCCLMEMGHVPDLPRYTSRAISSNIDKLCTAYMDLAEAFRNGVDALKTAMELHAEEFAADKNLGLVKQVLQALIRRKINNLTNTYVTLPLDHIANSVGLESAQEAEKHLVAMVRTCFEFIFDVKTIAD
jgi:COP9 signalosome complex subunit 3